MGDGSACFEVNMLVKSDGSRASSLVSELEGYVVWGSTPKLIFPPFYLKKKVWRYFRKWSKKRRPPSFPIGNKIDITYFAVKFSLDSRAFVASFYSLEWARTGVKKAVDAHHLVNILFILGKRVPTTYFLIF